MKKITSWRLTVWTEDGEEIHLMNIPNALAQEIDNWLTELEEEE
jgi:hypothetical protein